MKNYKYLIPLALVALMAASVYMAVSQAAAERTQYRDYLTEARRLAAIGVVEDAVENYEQALALEDSVEVSLEVGEVYADNGWISEAVSWGEYMTDHFPNEAVAYTFLLQQYIKSEDYASCFTLRDEAEARDVRSDEFNELLNSIEYVYEFAYNFYDDVSVYGNGLCAVMSNGKWGYADTEGNKEINCQFVWAGVFTADGIAPVQTEEGDIYYIADTGNKKVVVQNLDNCDRLGISVSGILAASDGGVYAYYNQEFEKIAGDYDYASAINGDVGAVEEGGNWYLVNGQGEKRSDTAFVSVITDEKEIVYRNDRVFVETDEGTIMADSNGTQVGSMVFEDACLFLESESYAAVEINGKWGFIDADGNLVIEASYEAARSFSHGYAAVEINGKWGFIDTDGNLVIEADFEDARDFNEQGCVFVKTSGYWQMLKLIKENY